MGASRSGLGAQIGHAEFAQEGTQPGNISRIGCLLALHRRDHHLVQKRQLADVVVISSAVALGGWLDALCHVVLSHDLGERVRVMVVMCSAIMSSRIGSS